MRRDVQLLWLLSSPELTGSKPNSARTESLCVPRHELSHHIFHSNFPNMCIDAGDRISWWLSTSSFIIPFHLVKLPTGLTSLTHYALLRENWLEFTGHMHTVVLALSINNNLYMLNALAVKTPPVTGIERALPSFTKLYMPALPQKKVAFSLSAKCP